MNFYVDGWMATIVAAIAALAFTALCLWMLGA